MPTIEDARKVLKQFWGYDSFLPLQAQAIEASLAGRDALIVLPTGGGKSVCYQVPALVRGAMTLVVSPLISLMKDQVDALRGIGITAAALNSSQSASQQEQTLAEWSAGKLRLLYVAPERLLTDRMIEQLHRNPPLQIAIDEAHCISSWGHDFRPEYRGLAKFREWFPDIPVAALTATATPDVRQDIAVQLQLRSPEILIGSFHRPNLIYHVQRRESGFNQICSVMDGYRNQSGIIYAISRAKVEQISNTLNQLGYRTLPYHAGLTELERIQNQEAFEHDEIEAIVATVAFGMGIDKSNVRYVIHFEMPRSIENYQQESGRAGRDRLTSECWLFYGTQDTLTWERVIQDSPEEVRQQAKQSLRIVQRYCHGMTCRHQFLVEYFDQTFEQMCQACDVCLGKSERTDGPLVVGQKNFVLCASLPFQVRCSSHYSSFGGKQGKKDPWVWPRQIEHLRIA
ncbi:MAG TPA: ATP-dependent DNA helicase RecQ [Pirellulaceae bacterium]|nr:ATP-dependent DNA helicase RecQ [Pirellulaceae bacterium]HMP69519.1 ATP-dependent DNA helicase RecQ [Pirellulaceae bacterium]